MMAVAIRQGRAEVVAEAAATAIAVRELMNLADPGSGTQDAMRARRREMGHGHPEGRPRRCRQGPDGRLPRPPEGPWRCGARHRWRCLVYWRVHQGDQGRRAGDPRGRAREAQARGVHPRGRGHHRRGLPQEGQAEPRGVPQGRGARQRRPREAVRARQGSRRQGLRGHRGHRQDGLRRTCRSHGQAALEEIRASLEAQIDPLAVLKTDEAALMELRAQAAAQARWDVVAIIDLRLQENKVLQEQLMPRRRSGTPRRATPSTCSWTRWTSARRRPTPCWSCTASGPRPTTSPTSNSSSSSSEVAAPCRRRPGLRRVLLRRGRARPRDVHPDRLGHHHPRHGRRLRLRAHVQHGQPRGGAAVRHGDHALPRA